MSRIARVGAMLGTSVVLTAALSGVAHAAPAPKAHAADCYVLVFSGKNYTGKQACITGSISNLVKDKYGRKYYWPGTHTSLNDHIRSVSIDKACTVTLYRDGGYKGKRSTWKRAKDRPGKGYWNVPDLGKSPYKSGVGDKQASSIKRTCSFST
ncbi:hypothetical protein GCM10029978_001400 [Actinoallomurus acanthiterrae]